MFRETKDFLLSSYPPCFFDLSSELVLDTPLSDDQRHSLKTVQSAAESLLSIIDNVLPDVPDALVGDARRLRQVLINLVGNAIKFTQRGEVVVRVDMAPGGDDSSVRFLVRDTGVGIARDKQETIFQAFEQADTSTTRTYGGTGLGLAIASRFVALMGGRILVDSEPGQGSAFSFTVRFERQAHSLDALPTKPPVELRKHPADLRRNDRRVVVDHEQVGHGGTLEQPSLERNVPGGCSAVTTG